MGLPSQRNCLKLLQKFTFIKKINEESSWYFYLIGITCLVYDTSNDFEMFV